VQVCKFLLTKFTEANSFSKLKTDKMHIYINIENFHNWSGYFGRNTKSHAPILFAYV